MKIIKEMLSIYKYLICSAFKTVKEILLDSQAWGDFFHLIGIAGGIIIFGGIGLAAVCLILYIGWTFTPCHEFFWIITILGSLCLCLEIGDWLKGD